MGNFDHCFFFVGLALPFLVVAVAYIFVFVDHGWRRLKEWRQRKARGGK